MCIHCMHACNLYVYIVYGYRRSAQTLQAFTTEVWKQRFWMAGFGSDTPKATTLWSNSRGIRVFATKFYSKGKHSLVTTYKDKSGRRRFQGNKRLKASQLLAAMVRKCIGHLAPVDAS